MKEIFYVTQTPKETNHEIKANWYALSIDVEKSCFV